jgi:predicted DsbA family dithiol-disulfide isomerase
LVDETGTHGGLHVFGPHRHSCTIRAYRDDVTESHIPTVTVDIWSDVVCPWCYIGKRRFEAAERQLEGELRIERRYHPYQLDPRAPRTPTPVLAAYAAKFGGVERAEQIIDHVTSTAAGEGLEFRMHRSQRANTFDAHRLLWLSGATGRQDELKERLLQAYFCDGADIADRCVLAECAAEVGLAADRVAAFLDSDDGVDEVHRELAGAVELGITAVPTYVINGVWSIPGAQDANTFVAVLRRMAAPAAE